MHHPEEANSFITLSQIPDMTIINTVSNHFDNFLNTHMTLVYKHFNNGLTSAKQVIVSNYSHRNECP
jgi:hypothetical protein